MKRFGYLSLLILLMILLSSCSNRPVLGPGESLKLASSLENGVSVVVALSMDVQARPWLEVTYTPEQAGFHLYGNTLPRNGVNGEGRPTLLQLPTGSNIRVVGDLKVSADAEVSSMGSDALLVYPAGPVRLSLPIALPPGKGWNQENVSITYEACSDMSCLPPVVDKLILIRVPSANLVKQPDP